MTANAGAGGSTSEAGTGGAAAAAGEAGKGAAAAGAAAGATGTDGKGAGAGADGAAAATGAAATGTGKEGDGAGGSKAPEKYTLTIPEGGRLAAGDLTHIEEIARKAGWSNEDAQAAVEEHDAALRAQSDRWSAETKADKDLGGDKLEATQQLTKAGIDFLFPAGDPHRAAFIEFLNRGGAGNNINVVRALARIGKQQREDGNISGSGGGDAPRAPEDVLYGKPATSS
jgi:hypothetical protein